MMFEVQNGATGAINGEPVNAPKAPAAKPVKKETTNEEGAE